VFGVAVVNDINYNYRYR